jgi:hypothetical protein
MGDSADWAKMAMEEEAERTNVSQRLKHTRTMLSGIPQESLFLGKSAQSVTQTAAWLQDWMGQWEECASDEKTRLQEGENLQEARAARMKATHDSAAKIARAEEKEQEEREGASRLRIKENREMRELLEKREVHKKKRAEEEERKWREEEAARKWKAGEKVRLAAEAEAWRLTQEEMYRERTMRGYCTSFTSDPHLVGNTPAFTNPVDD